MDAQSSLWKQADFIQRILCGIRRSLRSSMPNKNPGIENLFLFIAKTERNVYVKWYMKCFIYWTADLKSSKLWSSQLWTQFKQLRIKAWKCQDFNGVWTRDLAIPARRSNQLSYEATDVGSWSFVSSNEPVKNGCEVIYMKCFIYWTADFELK